MNKNTTVRKVISWLQLIWLVVGFWFLFVLVSAVNNWSKSLPPVRTIVVSGESKAVLTPDIATISFAVVSEGTDVTALQNENNAKINNAINFVKNQKIAPADIKTTSYNLSPKYEYDEKKRKSYISGYNLTQTVMVKIRDLNKVTDVIGGLPGLGINQLQGPNFTVDDLNKHLTKARQEAFQNAHAKAQELAVINKVHLGRVVGFTENGNNNLPPIFFESKAVLGMGGAAVTPDIEKGSEETEVTVSVTFEIK